MGGVEMAQPFNYSMQVPSAFEQMVSGLKLGASMQEMQAAAEQRRMQMEQMRAQQQAQQQQQERMNQLMDDVIGGRANRGTWLEIGMMGSSEAQRKGAWDQVANMDQQAVRSQIGFGSQLAFALKKNPAIGKQMVAYALRANPNDEFLKRINQLLETDTDFAAQTALLALPGLGKDGLDAYKETVNRLYPTPGEAAETAKKAAEARIKEAEANLAPQRFAADLGLTEAQTAQAQAAMRASDAAAKKSGADAAKARREAEMMSAGVIPVDKRPEAEGKMRREYSDQTKVYQDVKASYGRVLASREDAAGDLALIFNYMKMLDPGSVVREGEFATAQNAAGVPDRIWNLYNKTITGERLSGDQRKMFAKQAESLYKQALKDENTVRSGIERIAKGYGLNVANIFYTPTEEPPTAPAAEVSGAAVQSPAPARPTTTTQPVRGGRDLGEGFQLLD
jgi:hypothetical protein